MIALILFALIGDGFVITDHSPAFVVTDRHSPIVVIDDESRPATLADLKQLLGTTDKPAATSPPAIHHDGDDAAPTPQGEVDRVLAMLPKPEVGFVEFGTGAEARWSISAARRWGCRVTGIEIAPARAAVARERVREAGLGNIITIITGDAITTDVSADVGAAYLYDSTLVKLRPRIEKLRSFASYMHRPSGLAVVASGDSWIYTRPSQVAAASSPAVGAVWNGMVYSGPQCNNPNCAMCVSIRQQLATQAATPKAASGHYEKRCNGRSCWLVWVAD